MPTFDAQIAQDPEIWGGGNWKDSHRRAGIDSGGSRFYVAVQLTAKGLAKVYADISRGSFHCHG